MRKRPHSLRSAFPPSSAPGNAPKNSSSIIWTRFRADCDCLYRKAARSLVQYVERERPELRSIGLLIGAQVAHAPGIVSLLSAFARSLRLDLAPQFFGFG